MNRDIRRTGDDGATGQRAVAADPFTDHPLAAAFIAVDELREALRRHGTTFPSLGPDLASCTTTTVHRPLVALGRVNLLTAARLAEVLRKADSA